jgi:hypothetical protein
MGTEMRRSWIGIALLATLFSGFANSLPARADGAANATGLGHADGLGGEALSACVPAAHGSAQHDDSRYGKRAIPMQHAPSPGASSSEAAV